MDDNRDAFAPQGVYGAEPRGETAGRGTCSAPRTKGQAFGSFPNRPSSRCNTPT